MPLTIQGNWIVSVIVKNVQSLPQRFIISNATNGNGIHDGFFGNTISVTGNVWLINIQANEDYDLNGQWLNSTLRKTPTRQENGFNVFEIESEDLIQDNSYDDLVLQFKQPLPPIQPPVIIIPPVVVTPTTPVIPPPTIPPVIPVDLGSGRIYTKFKADEILPTRRFETTYGIWLDVTGSAIGNLLTYHNSSSLFFERIYQTHTGSCQSVKQFDITYGHKDGSGSRDIGGYDNFTPSKAVYGQYANLCLNNNDRIFKLNEQNINHFYAINVNRDRMGDKLDLGLTELNIHSLSGSQWGINQTHTGSNVKLGTSGQILRLIDDGNQYIVSGNLERGIYNPTEPHYYGLIYPKQGVILLDANKLDISSSFLTVTGSDVSGDNPKKLFTAMSGAALFTDDSGDYLGFKSRKFQYEYLSRYIVRLHNQDYNFSNNSTYQTGTEGEIIEPFKYSHPQTFVTTIGLYNENYELLAVGKVNYPKVKNFTTEALYEVKLKYK